VGCAERGELYELAASERGGEDLEEDAGVVIELLERCARKPRLLPDDLVDFVRQHLLGLY